MPDTPNSPGPGVDAVGRPVVDPTRNVETLVYQQNKRQDDLRHIQVKAVRREVHLEVKALRQMIDNFKVYQLAISEAETKRIDAIRAVDVAAVAVANTAAENRATTLAGQVNAAKDAQLVALKAETDPIRKDIGDLRQSQWTIAGGREQVVETRASGASWGLWVGIGVAVLGILSAGFMATMSVVVSVGVAIYMTTR